VAQKIFFTPGPAQLYPTFEKHLGVAVREQLGSISHRSKQFRALYQHTDEQLRALLDVPASHAILFTGSATEVWERAIQNGAGRETFHLVNGSFSKRFYEFAVELGRTARKAEAPFGEGFDADRLDIPATTELVCLTHNETSSGVSLPSAQIHALKARYPEALFVVDMVSSAPYPALDYGLVDSAFFSVQKGFGLPAGLGVWIVNEKFLAKAEALKAAGGYVGTHHSLPSLWKNAKNYETPATPNVLGIYLLGQVAEDMNRVGAGAIRRQTQDRAVQLYKAIGASGGLEVFVKTPDHRSATVIVAGTRGSAPALLEKWKGQNLVVGSGYGNYKEKQIRIANFPANTDEEIAQLLKAIGEV
jgi:phosphoserine aminotransferase